MRAARRSSSSALIASCETDVAVHTDSFHSLQSGKGNKTPDWVACGASKSLSCRPWDAASSLPLNGWVPNEGVISGSRRCPFLLKANERFFHTWRIASLNRVALLVFDRPFDFFNLPSRRLSPLRLSRPGADWIFSLLACAERTLYPDTAGGIADFKEALLFLAKQWYFYKIWNVGFVCTFVLGGFPRREHVPMKGIGWEFRSLRFGGTAAELKSPNRMRRMMQFQIRTNGSHFR